MVELLKQLRNSVTDDDISDAATTLGLQKSPESEDKPGESVVSAEVGSNDETDMLDEDIIHDTGSQATGYIGKSSEVQWLRRLQQETEHTEQASSRPGSPYGPPGTSLEAVKRRMKALKQRQQEKPHISTSASTFYLDDEGTEVDYTVEPYKLPTVEVAQRLLDRYMSTVQDVFPILPKQAFTDQVRQYYTSMAQGTPYQVAWVAIGIALRHAFALGLHLRNEDDKVMDARKETLVHAWWALYTLEASMSIIVGRPSLVAEDYYSTPLPLPASTEQLWDDALLSRMNEQGRGTSLYDTGLYGNAAEPKSTPSEPSNEGSFLKSMVRINLTAQRAMLGLYAPKVTTRSWKHVQGTIIDLYNELELWATSLPSGLSFLQPENPSNFIRERLILQMNYIRIKILITRPCLCRLDTRIPDQTKASSDFNRKMARTCIGAAKTFTDILPDQMNAAYLYQIGPWWSMVHHIMQVLTVLLLETSYNTVHLPKDNNELLPRIKTLFRWLRALKEKDRVAARASDVAFSILQGLATRIELDVSDLLQEDVTASSITTSQNETMVDEHDMGQMSSSIGEYGYNNQTVDSFMSAFPSALYPGDPMLSEGSGHAGTSFSESHVSHPPFDNAFDNIHDECNQLSTRRYPS
ncbi:hypothetical protein N0V95_002629 [Ascochyta clinopodiicola]|nr:hypothetical protein N0V95_002629 [Ascochyta clinopodiicola]